MKKKRTKKENLNDEVVSSNVSADTSISKETSSSETTYLAHEKKKKSKVKQFFINYFNQVKEEFSSDSPKTSIKNIFFMIFGSAILAFSYQLFYFSMNIISGGVSGLAIVINSFASFLSSGVWATILTWIFFFIGLIFLGPKFSIKTLISTIAYSLFMPLAQLLYKVDVFDLTSDIYKELDVTAIKIIAGLFGGGLTGLGCAITFIGGGSTGGVDCLILILNKFLKIKIGIISFTVDTLIILGGFFIFKDLVAVLIGIMAALVCSILMDKFFHSGTKQYLAIIISTRYKEISLEINYKLERGTTLLDSVGGFTNRKGYAILVCFDRKDYNDLLKIIHTIDQKAFVTVLNADEISGYGFNKLSFKKKRYLHINRKQNKNFVKLEEIPNLTEEEKKMEDIKTRNGTKNMSDNKEEKPKKKKKKKLSSTNLIILASSLTCGLVIGGGVGTIVTYSANKLSPYEKQIVELLRLLKNNWYYSYQYEDVDQVTTNMMISGLNDNTEDPYIKYGTARELGLISEEETKSFGFSYVPITDGLYVTNVLEQTNKNESFKPGVVINKIECKDKYTLSLDDFEDTNAFVNKYEETFNSETDNELTFTYHNLENYDKTNDVTPHTITIQYDYYNTSVLEKEYTELKENKLNVIIKLDTFMSTPYSYVTQYLDEIIKEKGNINTLVFDLTNNTGGFVNEATSLTKEFLDKGKFIYKTKNSKGKIDNKVTTTTKGKYVDTVKNIKLLTNSYTASASELFSQALIGNKRATQYGQTTYGKGISQTILRMKDGNFFKFTDHESFYPYIDEQGNYTEDFSLHNKGITPKEENKFTIYNDLKYFANDTSAFKSSYYQTKFIETYNILPYTDKNVTSNYYEDYLYKFLEKEDLLSEYDSSNPHIGVQMTSKTILRFNKRIFQYKEVLKQNNYTFMLK